MYTLQISPKSPVLGRIALAVMLLILAIAVSGPVCAQKPAADPALAAAQLELIRTQIATEKARQDNYRKQTEASALLTSEKPELPFLRKLVNDPADSVGALGAVIGMLVAFCILMGNRNATRLYRRDMQFYEALRRFGDPGAPMMRVSAAGMLAEMGKVRERRGRPYLDSAVDQLIAGYRLEENEAVRQTIADSLRQLISVEPLRIRRKLSDAKIKLPE